MNYQQFVMTINERVNYLFDAEIKSDIHTALKNNGTRRTGLTISRIGTNISPTIYLEEYYHQYQDGMSIEHIACNIVELYHEIKFEHSWEVQQLQDFERIKSQIVYKLIHRSQNKKLLEDIPFIPYLDLAIVFFVLLETTEHGTATITITKEMQRVWDVPSLTLYQLASINTPKLLPAEFKPMRTVICEMLGSKQTEDDLEDNHMYILSNTLRHLGASCILYNHVLEDIGNQLDEDFYILPSSIHETIILPARFSPAKSSLDEMIEEINLTQLDEEEILSNRAYYYDHQKNKLS